MDEAEFMGGAFVELETQAEETTRSIGMLTQEVARNGDETERASTKYRVSTARISSQISRSFETLITDGAKLGDVLGNLATSISRTTFRAAVRPVTDHIANGIGGVINGLLGFADGGAFSQGRVMPFARGGVVSGPVAFPMRGGTGLMGEAGPEAIMPLARGMDGRLGVRADGGSRGVNVVMNIQTQDAQSFQRSQSQIAAQMSRALSRGQRNR